MILINNFLHRQQLFEITRRWFYNVLEPGDIPMLKAIVNYNSIWTRRVGTDFSKWLFQEIAQQDTYSLVVPTKGHLKELLVKNPWYKTPRIEALIRRFNEHPERYFRETPFYGLIYTIEPDDKPLYIGSSRVKRIKRIAEKGARRISDYIFEEIKSKADQIVKQRADVLGVSRSALLKNPKEIWDEFERAERRVVQDIRQGDFFQKNLQFVLEDVLGVKAVVEDDLQPFIIEALEENPFCRVVEIEHHRGRYNATNIIIHYQPDKEKLLTPLTTDVILNLIARGMNGNTVQDEFFEFVLSGEDGIYIELILCNFQEMLESEIGASMHEARTFRQRQENRYQGYLAKNVSYLMEFMFSCGICPKKNIDEIPIKLWTPYMPDYFDAVLKDLFGIPTLSLLESGK